MLCSYFSVFNILWKCDLMQFMYAMYLGNYLQPKFKFLLIPAHE